MISSCTFLQYLVTDHFFRAVPTPLPASAEAASFAEGRVFDHLKELTVEIGHRQVGAELPFTAVLIQSRV